MTTDEQPHPRDSRSHVEPEKYVGDLDDCCSYNIGQCGSVGEIEDELGTERGIDDILPTEVALAAEQYEMYFYPGEIRCPDCGEEMILAVSYEEPMVFKFGHDGFEEFVRGGIEDNRWRKRNEA